jgi:microcystin-dependent protein
MGEPYVGELKIVSWNFAAKGWALCNGQILAIAQNQALFSLLGTTFGGNGTTTFALPDLRGRGPVHSGTMPGGGTYVPGQRAGETSHTLLVSELPLHPHTASGNNTVDAATNTNTATASTSLGQSIGTPPTGPAFTANMYGSGTPTVALAPQTIVPAGGNQPHDNMQPYTVLNYIIALVGVYPSRN